MTRKCYPHHLTTAIAAGWLLLAGGPASASPPADAVNLPGGETVLIGEQAPVLLAAADTGRMEEILWQLVDEDRTADAIAVLGYAARHRPQMAAQLAVLGVSVIADAGDGQHASDIISIIAAESGADPVSISQAVRNAGLAVDTENVENIASLEPASGPENGLPDLPETAADIATDNAAAAIQYSGQGGGRGGGGGLPPGLFIGGGGGGGGGGRGGSDSDDPMVPDPPGDAGAS